MTYLLKSFRKIMLAQLQRGRDIELSKSHRNVCVEDDFKGSLARLCKRGFVNTKMIIEDGKEIVCVFITQAGKIFLDKEDAKKLGSLYNII